MSSYFQKSRWTEHWPDAVEMFTTCMCVSPLHVQCSVNFTINSPIKQFQCHRIWVLLAWDIFHLNYGYYWNPTFHALYILPALVRQMREFFVCLISICGYTSACMHAWLYSFGCISIRLVTIPKECSAVACKQWTLNQPRISFNDVYLQAP